MREEGTIEFRICGFIRFIGVALCAAASFVFGSAARGDPPRIEVTAGAVKDVRPGGGSPGNVELTLKVSTEGMPADAKGFQVAVTKAVDDTGADLVIPQSLSTAFQVFPAPPAAHLTVKLKSPARTAKAIKELSGNVALFVPGNDPSATILVNSIQKHMGSSIQSDALKNAGIDVVIRTGEQFEALEQKNPFGGPLPAARPPGANPSNAVAVSFKGAVDNVVGCELRDKSSKAIPVSRSDRHSYHGTESERNLVYYPKTQLPEAITLAIFVSKPSALTKVPFALTDITLP